MAPLRVNSRAKRQPGVRRAAWFRDARRASHLSSEASGIAWLWMLWRAASCRRLPCRGPCDRIAGARRAPWASGRGWRSRPGDSSPVCDGQTPKCSAALATSATALIRCPAAQFEVLVAGGDDVVREVFDETHRPSQQHLHGGLADAERGEGMMNQAEV